MPSRYTVVRDRRDWGYDFGIEEVEVDAADLTDAEILALSPEKQAAVLADLGCILEEDCNGVLRVVTDPALDAPAAPAVSEAA